MKKIFAIIIMFFSLSIYSQKTDTISIKIQAANLNEALNQIEKQTNFSFFYQKKWLKNNVDFIDKNFEKESIEIILKSIFENTNLNFYLNGTNIILTENNVIYDKVVSNFLENSDYADRPILIQEIEKGDINSIEKTDKIIIIGN